MAKATVPSIKAHRALQKRVAAMEAANLHKGPRRHRKERKYWPASGKAVIGRVVCKGPEDEPAPTNEKYWVQITEMVAAAPDDPDLDIELDASEGDIVLAINIVEAEIHTHAVRVGQSVELKRATDREGVTTWVFFFRPMIFTALLGGQFSACGSEYVDGLALLDGESWNRTDLPDMQWNNAGAPDYQSVSIKNDHAYFKGRHWIATPAGNKGINAGTGLGWYNPATNKWVGVALGSSEYGGTGRALMVWAIPQVQTFTQTGSPDGGAFTITIDEETPVTVPFDASAEAMRRAICRILHCHESNVTVVRTGDTTNFVWRVTFRSKFYGVSLSLIEADPTGLTTGGIHTTENVSVVETTEAGDARLYYGQVGGSGDPPVALTEFVAIDFDPETNVVTVEDVGWIARHGESAEVINLFPYDDGTGEVLLVMGQYQSSEKSCIDAWDGTAFTDLEGPIFSFDEHIQKACVHDFEDGRGPALCICGRFDTIDSVSDFGNVARRYPSIGTWEKIGDGIGLAVGAAVHALASYNHRLWAGRSVAIDEELNIEALLACAAGATPVWRPAHQFVRDMIGVDFGGLYRLAWDGFEQTGWPASIYDLEVYNGRLTAVGDVHFLEKIRGFTKSGPFVRWDETEGVWQRNLPIVQGQINCQVPYGGGMFVGGKYKKALGGGVRLSNAGIWTDPNDPAQSGTWNNLAGGVVGEVFCACVYNGDLYVFGDITQAGPLAVKGVARWDGSQWHYVANFSDYGTVYACVVYDGELYIGGDFIKADGAPSLKILCKWDGSSLSAVFTDIDALDEHPEIRALHVYDDWLYLGGWFSEITYSGTLTVSSIARYDSGADEFEALEDNDTPTPSEGIRPESRVYTIGHSLFGGNVVILVGCDAGALAGQYTTSLNAATVWRWNPATPAWGNALALRWGVKPCRAITQNADGSVCLIAVEAAPIVSLEIHGPKTRVYRITGGSTTVSLGGLDGIFESDIHSLSYASVGGGLRPYAAGAFRSAGTVKSNTPRPINHIMQIGLDDRIVDVAGGVGASPYRAQFAATITAAYRLRFVELPNQVCGPNLVVCGHFSHINDQYSQFLLGIDLWGRVRAPNAYISGSRLGGFTGGADGVYDIKAVPEAEWPAWFADMLGECDPNLGFIWLVCGSFSRAIHEQIWDEDIGKVDEEVEALGVVSFVPPYFRAIHPIGYIDFAATVECYDNELVMAGGFDTIPHFWDGDHESGDWTPIVDSFATGNPNGFTNRMVRYAELLWVLGQFVEYPDFGSEDGQFAICAYDGAAATQVPAPGFERVNDEFSPSRPVGLCYAIGDMGSGEQLFVGGQASEGECPVVKRAGSDGTIGTWTAVGGSSQLIGTCQSLCVIEHPDGAVLLATGIMQVWNGSAFIPVDIAYFDGTTWHAAGRFGPLDVPTDQAIVSDARLIDPCEKDRIGAVVAGSIGVVEKGGATDTPLARQAYGIAEFRPDDEDLWRTYPGGGGCNGAVFAAGSCVRNLKPI